VLDYGAVANGSTDNTAAFQAAITAAKLTGKNVYIPGALNSYYFAQGSAALTLGTVASLRFVGDQGRTILQWHEGTTATPKYLFQDVNPGAGGTKKGKLYFEGITFQGTYTTRWSNEGGGSAQLDHYNSIEFHKCRWYSINTLTTDIHFCDRVVWNNCEWETCSRDGARARDCYSVSVTNCRFVGLGDDAVAIHNSQYHVTYNPDTGEAIGEGMIVTGCYFDNVSSCVSAQGARVATIANNVMLRTGYAGIFITEVGTEGVHPRFNIKIHDNQILDGYQTQVAINVTMPTMRGTAASGSVIPSRPAATSGAFVYPWDWREIQTTDAADPIPPLVDIDISRNTIGRTLPSVAAYSVWGFGTRSRSTTYTDPAVTDDDLRFDAGITVSGGLRVRVCDNTISNVGVGITYASQAIDPSFFNGMISGNTVFDCTSGCIVAAPGTARRLDLVISNNDCGGDYYRKSSNSLANGTYTSVFTNPSGIDLGAAKGVSVFGNKIANVVRPIHQAAIGDNQLFDNILVAQPSVIGANTANKGIGDVRPCPEGFRYIIADCDPTSATYGQITSTQYEGAASIPTAGYWVRGAYVRNTNPAIASGKTTLGWLRITTGSAHVSGTDWQPLVVANT
jgi:hypothetical protein